MGNQNGSYENTGNKGKPRKTCLLLIRVGDLVMNDEFKQALALNFLLP